MKRLVVYLLEDVLNRELEVLEDLGCSTFSVAGQASNEPDRRPRIQIPNQVLNLRSLAALRNRVEQNLEELLDVMLLPPVMRSPLEGRRELASVLVALLIELQPGEELLKLIRDAVLLA